MMSWSFTTRRGGVQITFTDEQFAFWIEPAIFAANVLDPSMPEPTLPDSRAVHRLEEMTGGDGPIGPMLARYAEWRLFHKTVQVRSVTALGTGFIPAWKFGHAPSGFTAEEAQILVNAVSDYQGEDPYKQVAAFQEFCRKATTHGGFIAVVA